MSFVSAQGLVSLPQQRSDLLLESEALLMREPITWAAEEGKRENPFAAVVDTPPPVVTEDNQVVARPVEPAPAQRLSDAVALKLIARKFKADGSLITSSRRVLRLGSGQMVDEGHVFAVAIQGERYEVSIESVTADGYTLKLGDARLQHSFTETDERAQRANSAS
jgi:hypothetical protein